MLECDINFMDKERFIKQLLLECGVLTFCPKNNHIIKTIDNKACVESAVKLGKAIFIACSQFSTVEELEESIRKSASKQMLGCKFCQDHPEIKNEQ